MGLFSASGASANPRQSAHGGHAFDVADLYRGTFEKWDEGDAAQTDAGLDEKLRQACFWIVNTAIVSPHYDIEFNDGASQSFFTGRVLAGTLEQRIETAIAALESA